ncbi:hypothetical protein ACPB8Q_00270 [Methanocaldococcus indicus]|uniref:hypothetical protein n=1 Tax=Methanocaldococcus indicus TaxID=213231 RepID=UPI003C6D10A9
MDDDIKEQIELLNKKILELEKRVDIKLEKFEEELTKKNEEILKKNLIVIAASYIKIMDDFKRNLKLIRYILTFLGLFTIILYIAVIILIYKLM